MYSGENVENVTQIQTPVRESLHIRPVELVHDASLIEEDITKKIQSYLARVITIDDLVFWLNRPLLVWDIVEDVYGNRPFWEFAVKIHKLCVFYTEQNAPESEMYDFFSKLLASH